MSIAPAVYSLPYPGSSAESDDIKSSGFTTGIAWALHVQTKLSRDKLEDLCSDLVDRTLGPCQKALSDAGIKTLASDNSKEYPQTPGATGKLFTVDPSQPVQARAV